VASIDPSANSSHDDGASAGASLVGPIRPRTAIVLASFLGCMTVTAALLSMTGGGLELASSGRSITPRVRPGGGSGLETILSPKAPLERDRWDGIVVHHTASPDATPERLDREHRNAGLSQLGYHVVIGNGRRMGDGEIHLGARWLEQLPGAHVAGPRGSRLNRTTIGICLVGDGDRRTFTQSQMIALVDVVRLLQYELGIDEDRVWLHRDLAGTTSPGQFFPEAAFRSALATDIASADE